MRTEADFKELRQNIMAISVKKYGWTYDEFHDIMEDWKFGRSLRKLSWGQLQFLRNKLLGIKDHAANEPYDSTGRYMYYLAKQVWPERTMKRLTAFWVKRYGKSNWNLLLLDERRATINMLKQYKGVK